MGLSAIFAGYWSHRMGDTNDLSIDTGARRREIEPDRLLFCRASSSVHPPKRSRGAPGTPLRNCPLQDRTRARCEIHSFSNRLKVLLAAKTHGSVFYDKLTPSIARPSDSHHSRQHPLEGLRDLSRALLIGSNRSFPCVALPTLHSLSRSSRARRSQILLIFVPFTADPRRRVSQCDARVDVLSRLFNGRSQSGPRDQSASQGHPFVGCTTI
jgi:hypothetical protein